MSEHESSVNFKSFGLSEALIKVLDEVGYETPSAIQEQCIPYLLNGHDVIGQAQAGTDKTAAFSLPLIDRIDISTNQGSRIAHHGRISHTRGAHWRTDDEHDALMHL